MLVWIPVSLIAADACLYSTWSTWEGCRALTDGEGGHDENFWHTCMGKQSRSRNLIKDSSLGCEVSEEFGDGKKLVEDRFCIIKHCKYPNVKQHLRGTLETYPIIPAYRKRWNVPINEDLPCMNGLHRVKDGWSGAGYGENSCNRCVCVQGRLLCQQNDCDLRQEVCQFTKCEMHWSWVAKKYVTHVEHSNKEAGTARCAHDVDHPLRCICHCLRPRTDEETSAMVAAAAAAAKNAAATEEKATSNGDRNSDGGGSGDGNSSGGDDDEPNDDNWVCETCIKSDDAH